MNKFKLILTICLVAVLTLTMGVATFASDPLTDGGEELVKVENEQFSPVEFSGTLSITDYEELRFYYNGIGYKANITDTENYFGYFVNIYNANDILYEGDLSVYTDEIYFDYTIMPLWIWTYLVDEMGYDASEGVPVESNQSILGVFSAVPSFIVNAVNSATGIFWANGALTMLGVLAIIAVAFGVCLLVVSLITRFMGFRG